MEIKTAAIKLRLILLQNSKVILLSASLSFGRDAILLRCFIGMDNLPFRL